MTKFRHLLLAAASAVAIASVSPLHAGQDTAQSTTIDEKYVGDKVGQISAAPVKGMEATELLGAKVLSSNNEIVGDINNLIVARSGEIHGVVIGVGGFLGMGEKNVVVPMERLEINKRDGNLVIVLNATKEELEAATAYDKEEWRAYSYNDMSEQPATGDQQAQTSEQPATGDQQAQTSEQPATTDQSATTNQQAQIGQADVNGKSMFEASKLIGKTVYSTSDENVGDINDILFSADGEMVGIVVGVGGFLGLGEKDVLVPLERLTITVVDNDSYSIRIDTTKEELEAAPALDAAALQPAN